MHFIWSSHLSIYPVYFCMVVALWKITQIQREENNAACLSNFSSITVLVCVVVVMCEEYWMNIDYIKCSSMLFVSRVSCRICPIRTQSIVVCSHPATIKGILTVMGGQVSQSNKIGWQMLWAKGEGFEMCRREIESIYMVRCSQNQVPGINDRWYRLCGQ